MGCGGTANQAPPGGAALARDGGGTAILEVDRRSALVRGCQGALSGKEGGVESNMRNYAYKNVIKRCEWT